MSPSLVKVRLTVKSFRTILKEPRAIEATIVLDVQIVDEHEWDEKAVRNIIVVEVDVENDGDEGVTDWSTTASAPALAVNNTNGAALEHRGRHKKITSCATNNKPFISAPLLPFDIPDPQSIDGGPRASTFLRFALTCCIFVGICSFLATPLLLMFVLLTRLLLWSSGSL